MFRFKRITSVLFFVLLLTMNLNASIDSGKAISSFSRPRPEVKSISYSESLSSVDLSVGQSRGFSYTLSIPQFDPVMGHLESVEIDYSFSQYGSVYAYSFSDVTLYLEEKDIYNFVGISHNNISATLLVHGFEIDSIPSEQLIEIHHEGIYYSKSSTHKVTNPDEFSEYIGDGNIEVEFYGELNSKNGFINMTADNYADIDYQVTYSYVLIIPEPASVLILCFGAVLLRKRIA